MSFIQQLKEAFLVTENVKAELSERKYFFRLAHHIAAIAGIIFGIGSYFALYELLPSDFGSNLFALFALVTVFYFIAKFIQIILGFVLWVVARLFHYKLSVVQIIKSINFAFLPLWLAAPVAPFISIAPTPISGPALYIAYIFIIITLIWFIRSLIQVMDALLSNSIHQAIIITGVSCAFILTWLLIFT